MPTISAIIVNAARFQPMPLWIFSSSSSMNGSASSSPVLTLRAAISMALVSCSRFLLAPMACCKIACQSVARLQIFMLQGGFGGFAPALVAPLFFRCAVVLPLSLKSELRTGRPKNLKQLAACKDTSKQTRTRACRLREG